MRVTPGAGEIKRKPLPWGCDQLRPIISQPLGARNFV
jgi:hypothetical protein